MPPEAWDALTMADLYRKGLPPVAGGALDQAAVFIECCRFAWSEEAGYKAEIGLDDDG